MDAVTPKPFALLPHAAYSSSAGTITGTPVTFSIAPNYASALVRVTQAPTSSDSATATLDVFLQHSVNYSLAGPSSSNGAAIWDDFLHFPQIASGSVATRSAIAAWSANVAPSSSLNMHAPVMATLAAGQVINGATGDAWRVQAVVGGTSPVAASSSAWTFSVVVQTGR